MVDTSLDSDQTINGQVFADEINSITFLEINETPPSYMINDFTGIEDFVSLEILRFIGTRPTIIDFGDLTNLIRVEEESNIELTSVDFSSCLNLEEIVMNGPNLETLFLPQTNTLEIFSSTNEVLTHLDLSFYSEYTILLDKTYSGQHLCIY